MSNEPESTVASWRSPRTEVRRSPTQGRGVFACQPIAAGELVAVKGGHLTEGGELRARESVVGDSYLQIADDLYLAPRVVDEHDAVMMFLNHSCDPNAGVLGSILFVARRAIEPGEEVTIDYATIDDGDFSMECHCGAPACRGVVHGRDWQRPELQDRHRGYFSSFLTAKIEAG